MTLSQEYLEHNMNTIKSNIANMGDQKNADVCKAIDLLSAIVDSRRRNIDTIMDDSDEEREKRDLRYRVIDMRRLELITLIASL
jgi:hypothetical protein